MKGTKKSESSSLLADEFLDLNDTDTDDQGSLTKSLLPTQFRTSRIFCLTVLTLCICAAFLGWSASAVSQSATSVIHHSNKNYFARDQQVQTSDWGKSAAASRTRSTPLARLSSAGYVSYQQHKSSLPAVRNFCQSFLAICPFLEHL